MSKKRTKKSGVNSGSDEEEPARQKKKDDLDYVCDLCELPFSTKSNVTRHKKTAHRIGNYEQITCEICYPHKSFKQKSDYNKHMVENHSDQPPPLHHCPTENCPFKTKRSFNLAKHVKMHEMDIITNGLREQRNKMENMLSDLAKIADNITSAEPIAAHPHKIRKQIEDNAATIEGISRYEELFTTTIRAANDVIIKAIDKTVKKSDPLVKDIENKLDNLNQLWIDVQNAMSKRDAALKEILSVAEKLWPKLQEIMELLDGLEVTLTPQLSRVPIADPQEFRKQQVELQEIHHKINQTKPDVECMRYNGNILMLLCGELDKPEVKKHIENLDHVWNKISVLYARRETSFIDAVEKAVNKFMNLGPIGIDTETIKKQIEQLKHFEEDAR